MLANRTFCDTVMNNLVCFINAVATANEDNVTPVSVCLCETSLSADDKHLVITPEVPLYLCTHTHSQHELPEVHPSSFPQFGKIKLLKRAVHPKLKV